MKTDHFEILVEEPSMESFLIQLLPRLLQDQATFNIHVHQGKSDLLGKLERRLRGYSKWLPISSRIIVIIDRDDSDCSDLKKTMEDLANTAGLKTRTAAGSGAWRVSNRIAVEELEAWFFGEWSAVKKSFPRVSATIPSQAAYRHPDRILGGTWEALERVLKNAGYFSGGLRKLELAATVGKNFDPAIATSPSFIAFRNALIEATS